MSECQGVGRWGVGLVGVLEGVREDMSRGDRGLE